MNPVEHVIGYIEDLLGSYLQRIEDLLDGLWEWHYLIKVMTSKVQVVAFNASFLKRWDQFPLAHKRFLTYEGAKAIFF